MRILILNCGSSSLKYRLFNGETVAARGLYEQIGSGNGREQHQWQPADRGEQSRRCHTDHRAALTHLFAHLAEVGQLTDPTALAAVGHRVVHGGEQFSQPVIIDPSVLAALQALIPLAPLHNPAGLLGIEIATQLCNRVPQIALFDTAFHHTLPPHAYHYALPYHLYRDHALRRYGFHGQSHAFVSREALRRMGREAAGSRLITLHLGNGSSLCALRDGVSIDTSMGLTPLAGLVMGSRCGDLDPALPAHIAAVTGQTMAQVMELLNRESGLKGLCGVSDMRELLQRREEGDPAAQLAFDLFIYRIVQYIGSYFVVLGGVDGVIFTGGIGERAAVVREQIVARLAVLGAVLDHHRNAQPERFNGAIAATTSRIALWVIPTDEEGEMARQCRAVLNAHPTQSPTAATGTEASER